ncbi:MAG: ATP-binding protein [Planctomicrobium sp.]|nr:ATP-binding protein [Planctomicrobium sp.]
MDTIGSIQTSEFVANEQSNRQEVLERLRYLAIQRRCGIMVGRRGSGKSQLLQHLKTELELDGISSSVINLGGVTAAELPFMIAADLGLGLASNSDALTTWLALQDYAVGCQQSATEHVFIFDQIDRAPAELAMTLERLLSLFDSTFACLFAARPGYHPSFKSLFKNHSWLRVDLERLSESEVTQSLAKHLATEDFDIQISKEASSAAHVASNGRIDKLQRLTELAILAAEAEEIRVINEEIIRSIQSELKVK